MPLPVFFLRFLFAANLKYAADVETKMNIATKKVAGRFCEEGLFSNPLSVGKNQLEYVTTSFNIKTNGQWVAGIGKFVVAQVVVVFYIEAGALGELKAITRTEGYNIVGGSVAVGTIL